jgi:transposase
LHSYNTSWNYRGHTAGAPMTPLRLSAREREGLQDLLARGPFAKQACRIQALLWLAAGQPAGRIAQVLGVSRRTVYYWAQRFQERADLDLADRLADAPRPGRPPTALGVIDPLIAGVIDRDPRELGYQSPGWTNHLLRRYLRQAHRLSVSRKSVSLALARLGIRWKRPRHQLALRPDTWRQAKGGSNAASSAGCAPCC